MPNRSVSLRTSVGGLPFPPLLISWVILRTCSYLLFTPACLSLDSGQGVRLHHQDEIASIRCKCLHFGCILHWLTILKVILSWPKPNYTHPETRGDALLVVNSVLIALVVIIVGLRMYTRLVIKRWFGLDDIFILTALVGNC